MAMSSSAPFDSATGAPATGKIAHPEAQGGVNGGEKVVAQATSDNDVDLANGLEQWNSSRANTYRFCATNLSFLIMGMNDACIGVSPVPEQTSCEIVTDVE